MSEDLEGFLDFFFAAAFGAFEVDALVAVFVTFAVAVFAVAVFAVAVFVVGFRAVVFEACDKASFFEIF